MTYAATFCLLFFSDLFPLLKVLVPNYAAGAIIGKGGQNISQLQSTYGARIKLSQNNDCYPGTQERIAVITGDVEKVIDLHKYVMDKIRNEANQAHGYAMDETRQKQAKIIVPNGTAGLLIGKGGSMIRSMMEQSGAKILISNKDHEQVHGERVVTVTGSEEENEDACRLIITKVATDSSNMMNRNLSYSGNNQFGRMEGNQGGNSGGYGSQGGYDGGLSALSSVLGNLAGKKNQQANLLAPFGLPNANSSPSGAGIPSNILRGGNPLIAGSSQLALQMLNQGGANASNLPHIKTKVTVEMHIPDALVGAILGKGGKTIVEFINYSGAKIQFSGKGEYVPGTNDRILTIEGDFTSTQVAHYLICQKIIQADVETK
eukprot:Seg4353.1 transcript_id=Seg4353.1/GoldUCD/mRNA.D3Y31 product="RNA-binding protein Nova-1" protein_id=Seg4353.1/GoldUCD/D3Y31